VRRCRGATETRALAVGDDHRRQPGARHNSPWLRLLVGVALELLLFVAVTAWLFPSLWRVSNALVDEDQSAGPELGVTLSEVADHPQPMWGQTVVVSAQVATLVNQRTMLIGSDTPIVGDTVLVVSPRPLAALLDGAPDQRLAEGDVARVTGEIRRFSASELEAAFGIGPQEVTDYDGEAVIIASSIELEPPVGVGAGDPEFGGSAGPEVGISVEDIHNHPERYYGRRVAVSGEVEHVYGPHIAWLRDEGVLVVREEAAVTWFDEASAFVVGEVRRFDPAALEGELAIDLGDAQLMQHAGEPVIVAASIEVVK